MDLNTVRSLLSEVHSNYLSRNTSEVFEFLKSEKKAAVLDENELLAKELWSYENILEAQNFFVDAFNLCRDGKFYDGWCLLERAEVSLLFLKRHVDFNDNIYQLEYMESHIPKLQSLFPYRVFFSPEFIGKSLCSICGTVITPRKKCLHIKGEIYKGEMCMSIISNATLLGSAITKNPVQKYSVLFFEGGDHYRYDLVNYYLDKVESPFHSWGLTITTKIIPHSQFNNINNSDGCPCGDEKTYSECCLLRSGVTMPHHQFHFSKVKQGVSLKSRITS